MGQEIDRARALLTAITRESILPAEQAAQAYEAWVAQDTEAPFGAFLIRGKRADPERVRRILRLQAVQGMVHPDRFTAERFQDLLMGQLGIDAGLLSAKLLQTVRAVQDKKAEEGKLRRLDELLPRAGFDKASLDLLHEHLTERVLICPGCLGRYPRKDQGAVVLDCPRCDQRIAVEAAKPSSIEALPEAQRVQLMASSESAAVFDTLSVAARQRSAPGDSGDGGKRALVILVGLATLVLLAAGLLASQKKPPAKRPPPPKPTPSTGVETPPTKAPPPGPSGPPTLAEALALDRRLAAEGRWDELLETWRRVVAGEGESQDELRRAQSVRVTEVERLVARAAEVTRDLAAARGSSDDAAERRLTLALAGLDGPAGKAPPFAEAQDELDARRTRRRDLARSAGAARLEAARRRGRPQDEVWVGRLAQLRRSPLLGLEVGGRSHDGVVAERLDARGFALKMPDGALRELSWHDDPLLALGLVRRARRAAADPAGLALDDLELLRRALLARDARAAEEARAALGVGPDALDIAATLAQAPTLAAPTPLDGGARHRLRWPLAQGGHDPRPDAGTTVEVAGGALRLTGPRAVGASTLPLPLAAPLPGSGLAAGATAAVPDLVTITVRLEGPLDGTAVAVELVSARGSRTYVVRQVAEGWRLEVDLGAGANVLRQGPGTGRAVKIALGQTELGLWLDEAERATAPLTARCESVRVHVSAAAGGVAISELVVTGALDRDWLARTGGEYARAVEARLEPVERRVRARAGTSGEAAGPLSVEDSQGLAEVPAAVLTRLEEARAKLAQGDLDAATELLRALEQDAPACAPVLYTRGLAAAQTGDLATAVRALSAALAREPIFPEARGLMALTLAMAGRRGPALVQAKAALEDRPDLAHAHLARARCAWLDRHTDAGWNLETHQDDLGVPLVLAPDDPLVRQVDRAMRRGQRLDELLPLRLPADGVLVLAPSGAEAPAKDALKVAGALVARFERALRLGRADAAADGPLLVALVPQAEWAAWAGTAPSVRWDRELAALLVRDRLEGGPASTRAAADGWVARTYGAPPAWLEQGLASWLAGPATGEDPAAQADALRNAPRWTRDEWLRLLSLERGQLRPLDEVKAWGLVGQAQRQAPSLQQLASMLDQCRKGNPAPWPGQGAAIDLSILDEQIARGLRR